LPKPGAPSIGVAPIFAVLRAGAPPAKIITMSVEPITNGGESPCTEADYWGTDRENKETGRIRQAQGNVAPLSGGAELAKLTATDRATKAVAIEKHWPGP